MIKKLTAALFAGPPLTDWLAEYLLEKIMEVIQELYGREFDESEVEREVEDACSMFYGQKPAQNQRANADRFCAGS